MQFQQAPPPETAPVQSFAQSLGLPAGLRAENYTSQYRCASCSTMQPKNSVLVWVPDCVRKSDPVWAVVEEGRINAYNGSGSGWCLKCCQKWMAKPKNICAPSATEIERTGDLWIAATALTGVAVILAVIFLQQ